MNEKREEPAIEFGFTPEGLALVASDPELTRLAAEGKVLTEEFINRFLALERGEKPE